jgi:hypothetical protein
MTVAGAIGGVLVIIGLGLGGAVEPTPTSGESREVPVNGLRDAPSSDAAPGDACERSPSWVDCYFARLARDGN